MGFISCPASEGFRFFELLLARPSELGVSSLLRLRPVDGVDEDDTVLGRRLGAGAVFLVERRRVEDKKPSFSDGATSDFEDNAFAKGGDVICAEYTSQIWMV